jgi:hypothetical protein
MAERDRRGWLLAVITVSTFGTTIRNDFTAQCPHYCQKVAVYFVVGIRAELLGGVNTSVPPICFNDVVR